MPIDNDDFWEKERGGSLGLMFFIAFSLAACPIFLALGLSMLFDGDFILGTSLSLAGIGLLGLAAGGYLQATKSGPKARRGYITPVNLLDPQGGTWRTQSSLSGSAQTRRAVPWWSLWSFYVGVICLLFIRYWLENAPRLFKQAGPLEIFFAVMIVVVFLLCCAHMVQASRHRSR